MALPKVIPALADLTQDIAGAIPLELLQHWAVGEQDLAAAASLLRAFQIQGTVVATDTSGLSRLTRATDLLDVLSQISQPKEIVHALGSEIGGRAIGTWVADNSEMFYPVELEQETVVDAMAEAQHRIRERLPVRIGMCIHSGSFYEIGGGLYGGEADRVEYLAEECAGPEEILLTERVFNSLKTVATDELILKKFPHDSFEEQAYLLKSVRRLPQLEERQRIYPHPFPQAFFELLPHFHQPADMADLKQKVYAEWSRERTVVFLARHHEPEARTMAGLLDDLVINALMDTVIRKAIPGTEYLASSGGGIAILTFESPQDAMEFTRGVSGKLAENGLPVRVGIDAGTVLLFQNSHGPSGLAGNPVNIASKLAEDAGRPGYISVTDRAAEGMKDCAGQERFELAISGITITGVNFT